jgi:hypothetical protein
MQFQKRGLELGARSDLLNETWNIFSYRSSVLYANASNSDSKAYERSACQKRKN